MLQLSIGSRVPKQLYQTDAAIVIVSVESQIPGASYSAVLTLENMLLTIILL